MFCAAAFKLGLGGPVEKERDGEGPEGGELLDRDEIPPEQLLAGKIECLELGKLARQDVQRTLDALIHPWGLQNQDCRGF